MLTHANADQINAVSEMVLNLLKNRIPVKSRTLNKLKRHKKVLREVGEAQKFAEGGDANIYCVRQATVSGKV